MDPSLPTCQHSLKLEKISFFSTVFSGTEIYKRGVNGIFNENLLHKYFDKMSACGMNWFADGNACD